jgi:hypothetical protein
VCADEAMVTGTPRWAESKVKAQPLAARPNAAAATEE